MANDDILARDTEFAKNSFEEYIYAMRSNVSGGLAAYASEDERSTLLRQLEECENWLYDEGEDTYKDVYNAKLDQLKAIGDPIEERAREAEERPRAVTRFRERLTQLRQRWNAPNDKFVDLDVSEKQRLEKLAGEKEKWLAERIARQDSAKPDEPIVIFSNQISSEIDVGSLPSISS